MELWRGVEKRRKTIKKRKRKKRNRAREESFIFHEKNIVSFFFAALRCRLKMRRKKKGERIKKKEYRTPKSPKRLFYSFGPSFGNEIYIYTLAIAAYNIITPR